MNGPRHVQLTFNKSTHPTIMYPVNQSFWPHHLCRPIFAEPFFSDHLCQVICPFVPPPNPDPICQCNLLPLCSLRCYADDARPGGHQLHKIDGQAQNNPDLDPRQAMRHPTQLTCRF